MDILDSVKKAGKLAFDFVVGVRPRAPTNTCIE